MEASSSMALAAERSTRMSPWLNEAQPQKAGRAARSSSSLFVFIVFAGLLISVIIKRGRFLLYYIIWRSKK